MSQIETQLSPLPDDPDALPVPTESARPKTGMVVGLLAGVALIFSYLFAYCGTNALLTAEVISPWKPGSDPRPKLLGLFAVLFMGLFCGIGALARWASRKQLSSIDAMETDEA
jgi:uncharacterized membrane protein YedE/YeeE